MKKIITLVIFTFLYQVSFSQTWIQRDSFSGQGRSRAASFSIGDTCYVVAGGSNAGVYLKTAYAYDTLTNTWWQIASYPGSGSDNVVGFAINGKGYVGTGAVGGYQYFNDFWEYDPGSNAWTPIPSFPGQPRSFDVSFVINGKGYVGGGDNGFNNNPLNDFWAYDPVANQWDSVALCPASGVGQQACGFSIGNKGYVGTGVNLNVSNTDNVQDFWEYDPTIGHLGTWIQEDSFPGAPRALAAGFGFCDKGYLGCGNSYATGNPVYNDFWQFDPLKGPKGKWTQVANYGGRIRCALSVFVVGKSAFAGLGADYNNPYPDSNPLDFYEYHPIFIPAFAADSTVCSGDTILFTDTSNWEPEHWLWSFGGGTANSDTIQNPTVKYDTVGSWNVTLLAWNDCGDSGIKTFTNYVTAGKGGVLTVIPLSPKVCNGQSVTLKITDTTGNFTWSPSTGLSETIGDSVIASPSSTIIYTVKGMDSLGCNSIGTDSVIIVHAQPLIIQPQDTSLCNGSSVALVVPASGTNYVWSPVATLSSSTGNNVIATPTVQTTYSVTGIDSLGCIVSDSDIIYIRKGVNKPVVSDTENVLTSTATQGNQWYKDGSEINGATGETYDLTDTGCYYTIATNIANGCSSISNTVCVTTLSGINRLSINPNQLSIYPNPTGGEIFVNISSSVADVKDWNLQISDVLGRTLYTRQSLNYSNDIDLSYLPGGVYFITVTDKTARAVVPVVKE